MILASSDRKHLIDEAEYWRKRNNIDFTNSFLLKFIYLAVDYKEYRNLIYCRMSQQGMAYRCLTVVLMIFLPRMKLLQIPAKKTVLW